MLTQTREIAQGKLKYGDKWTDPQIRRANMLMKFIVIYSEKFTIKSAVSYNPAAGEILF